MENLEVLKDPNKKGSDPNLEHWRKVPSAMENLEALKDLNKKGSDPNLEH